ncbi:putative quorum-sensing-regulated virulence factor [Acinetobacter indicus]|uniref:putative quorum-sensing-regulated virulence factor n=1 Tax=Acinetobacter indicus TaxID=756892 RepID=UPI0025774B0F|nr:DUF3820 family protein [Acinetobacter indicus]MDM1771068.1 DUF3820 family protein [Acinetobacter indicus]MDM1773740.1 DUF3820 family protein [Acinetobacter indicus]
MKAIILDTETHTINGYPIEIAYAPCFFKEGALEFDSSHLFDEYFSCPKPIAYGAMAVHHILESDIADKPSYDTFKLPEGVDYIIGHNIGYDIEAIGKCGPVPGDIKTICTLALARTVWPDNDSRTLSALFYFLSADKHKARIPKVMPFGKHKGVELNKVPKDYVKWFLGQDNIDSYLRKALEVVA